MVAGSNGELTGDMVRININRDDEQLTRALNRIHLTYRLCYRRVDKAFLNYNSHLVGLNVLLGFISSVVRLPWDNIGVAVFSNDNDFGGFLTQSITYRLLDEALGLEPIDWNGRCVRI